MICSLCGASYSAWQASQSQHVCHVLVEVQDELRRQHRKWGEQNHPDGTGHTVGMLAQASATAAGAKAVCDALTKDGTLTYADILWEEVAEALEEKDPAKLREELKQVSAVAAAWMQKIDRDLLKARGPLCECMHPTIDHVDGRCRVPGCMCGLRRKP